MPRGQTKSEITVKILELLEQGNTARQVADKLELPIKKVIAAANNHGVVYLSGRKAGKWNGI